WAAVGPVAGVGGAAAPPPQPLAVDSRLAAVGRQDLGVEAGRLHQAGQVLRRAAHVGRVDGVAGDRGDGAPVGQLGHERVRLGLHEGVDVGHTELLGSALKWTKRRQEATRGPGSWSGRCSPVRLVLSCWNDDQGADRHGGGGGGRGPPRPGAVGPGRGRGSGGGRPRPGGGRGGRGRSRRAPPGGCRRGTGSREPGSPTRPWSGPGSWPARSGRPPTPTTWNCWAPRRWEPATASAPRD